MGLVQYGSDPVSITRIHKCSHSDFFLPLIPSEPFCTSLTDTLHDHSLPQLSGTSTESQHGFNLNLHSNHRPYLDHLASTCSFHRNIDAQSNHSSPARPTQLLNSRPAKSANSRQCAAKDGPSNEKTVSHEADTWPVRSPTKAKKTSYNNLPGLSVQLVLGFAWFSPEVLACVTRFIFRGSL